MFVFGGLNRLEVPRFRNVGHVPQGWGAVLSSHPSRFVELTAEGRQVGGPPGFGVVRGSGNRSMLLQECRESV